MRIHPFVKVIYFVLILLLISIVGNLGLHVLLVLLSIATLILDYPGFLRTIKRMRWLFLSIMVIYGFGTPGELIPQFPVNFAPSYEGLQLGMIQIEKLLIALASLHLLLMRSTSAQLMLGLYMLLKPLGYLGLNVKKFAARLLLTLDYVEDFASSGNSKFSFKQLDEIHISVEHLPEESVVYFEKIAFSRIDKVMIIFGMMALGFMIFRGVS